MEIDENIESYFSKTINVTYYDKPNRILKGDLYCSITEISIQSKIDSKIRTEYIKYPDIQELKFIEEGKICIKQKEKLPTLIIVIQDPIYLYKVIFVAFKYFFPFENVFQFITVINELKLDLKPINDEINNLDIHNLTPCNNFSRGIAFCAKSKNLEENDEIIWDIDTVYAAKDTKRFILKDFDHLNNLKKWFLWPVLCTLGYNSYFTEISLSFLDLNPYEKVLEHLFLYNRKIERLEMAGCKLKVSGLSLIIPGLCQQTNLRYIDLSQNEQFGDSGAQTITRFLEERGPNLEVFRMMDCNLTSVSLDRIGNAFHKSVVGKKELELNLKILDVSNNTIKDSFNSTFCSVFLSLCKKLDQLYLSNMSTALHKLAPSVSSLHETLTIIDLSGNVANPQLKSTVWTELFVNTKVLKSLNMSNFKISDDCLFQSLLHGLTASQGVIPDLELKLSNCNLKGKHFEDFMKDLTPLRKISHLDLSYNDIGFEFEKLVNSLPMLKNLKSLNFSGNLLNVKPKEVHKLLDLLSQCLQEESSLEDLNLSNCNIGPTISVLINDIDCLFTIRKLDISGNNFGNIVGRCFGRMLAIDKHLQQVNIDNNGISKEIYEEILDNLQTNNTLDTFKVPFVDLNKYPTKAVTLILDKINKHHQKMHRIYQGLTLDDIRNYACDYEMIHTLALLEQMKDDLIESSNRLKSMEHTEATKDCLKRIEITVREIDMTKTVDSKLKTVLLKSEDSSINIETNTRKILMNNSIDLTKAFNEYLENVVKNMLVEMEGVFPSLFQDTENELKKDILDKIEKSMKISERYIQKLNDKFLQKNIKNKVLEIHSILSEKAGDIIIDKLVDKAKLLETEANRIINRQTKEKDSSISDDAISPISLEVKTRSNKLPKINQLSVRTSRRSFLSASTTRPMSHALKNTSEISEEEPEPSLEPSQLQPSKPPTRSSKPNLLPLSSLQRIEDDDKSMDETSSQLDNYKVDNDIAPEKPIIKCTKPVLLKPRGMSNNGSLTESMKSDDTSSQLDDHKVDIDIAPEKPIIKGKKPVLLKPRGMSNNGSLTESMKSDSTDELNLSVAIKSRPKPPRTKKKSDTKITKDTKDEAVDKFLQTDLTTTSTEVPGKKGFFSKMIRKKNDINLDKLGCESPDTDNENQDSRTRAMSVQSAKKKESSKLSKKTSG